MDRSQQYMEQIYQKPLNEQFSDYGQNQCQKYGEQMTFAKSEFLKTRSK